MARKKIVLYNPQSVFFTFPLALLAIGSSLDPRKYDVRIIDGRLVADPVAAVLRELEGAAGLGVTVLTGAPIRDALRVSRAAKAAAPNIPVIWGGWHPSLFPTQPFESGVVDVTVQGQGEATFAELVECILAGQPLAALPGIAYRQADRSCQNPPRPLVDMNTFPAHNYDLLPVEDYFQQKGQRQIDYISSTGCHFRCAFCADPFVYGRRWTGLSPERIGAEVALLWEKYRFVDLAFQDETFFTYSSRVAEIAEQFLRRKLQFTWTATLRADQNARLSEDVFDLCVRSGLRQVMIGVESGSQEVLDKIKKDIRIDQVLEAAERCARYKVGAIFPFIVGFPGESQASVRESQNLVKQLRAMSPRFETPVFYYKPYPGSQIADQVVREGFSLPQTLEEWAEFDFVGSSGPWVSPKKYRQVERFKFYNRLAGGPETWRRRPLQWLARWRCRRDFYHLPLEKFLVENIKPQPRLS